SRSEVSILKEAEEITKHPDFKGIIFDVGGPTANMYGIDCSRKLKKGSCKKRRCLYPSMCRMLNVSHQRQIDLLKHIRNLPGVKKVFVASGIRYDLVLNDKEWGEVYMRELVAHHISGQMKIAPEHTEEHVLELMGKPSGTYLIRFRELFNRLNKETGKRQFLTYYFIAAYPGCDMKDMIKLKSFVSKQLRLRPEQVQIFTPTPSTYAALMYWTGVNPFSTKQIFVERDIKKMEKQKGIMRQEGTKAFL
ncbi:MAG: YgiQ family radical SAM protein, partial [bacterium]